jgi:hypothetical protein
MCKGCEPIQKEAVCGCGCNLPRRRRFFSKEEEIETLEEYKKELEKEIKGIERKISELR